MQVLSSGWKIFFVMSRRHHVRVSAFSLGGDKSLGAILYSPVREWTRCCVRVNAQVKKKKKSVTRYQEMWYRAICNMEFLFIGFSEAWIQSQCVWWYCKQASCTVIFLRHSKCHGFICILPTAAQSFSLHASFIQHFHSLIWKNSSGWREHKPSRNFRPFCCVPPLEMASAWLLSQSL